jgi:hypothetical protein
VPRRHAGTEVLRGDAVAKVARPLLYCSIRDRIAPSGTQLWHQIEGVLVEMIGSEEMHQ